MGKIALVLFMAAVLTVFFGRPSDAMEDHNRSNAVKFKADNDQQTDVNASRMLTEGRQTFRFDTFGDEAFWTDALQLHRAIEGEKFGGVGPGVSPKTALAVGLKVDSEVLPNSLVAQLKKGRVNLDDPATTLALLKLNAVVGVRGTFNTDGSLKTIGITCALCHSTVDDSFAPGIGQRLDGWAARDLNVGAIVPADARAWSILRYQYVLKRFRLESGERRGANSQWQQKLGNVISLNKFLARELVLPPKRHHAPLARVTVKFKLAKR